MAVSPSTLLSPFFDSTGRSILTEVSTRDRIHSVRTYPEAARSAALIAGSSGDDVTEKGMRSNTGQTQLWHDTMDPLSSIYRAWPSNLDAEIDAWLVLNQMSSVQRMPASLSDRSQVSEIMWKQAAYGNLNFYAGANGIPTAATLQSGATLLATGSSTDGQTTFRIYSSAALPGRYIIHDGSGRLSTTSAPGLYWTSQEGFLPFVKTYLSSYVTVENFNALYQVYRDGRQMVLQSLFRMMHRPPSPALLQVMIRSGTQSEAVYLTTSQVKALANSSDFTAVAFSQSDLSIQGQSLSSYLTANPMTFSLGTSSQVLPNSDRDGDGQNDLVDTNGDGKADLSIQGQNIPGENQQPNRSKVWWIVLAVVGVILLLILVFYFIFRSHGPTTVMLPPSTSMSMISGRPETYPSNNVWTLPA